MLEAVLEGIANVFRPDILLWVFVGVIIGLVVGILPGIGGVATMAILLPFIYGKEPVLALAFIIALITSTSNSGFVTSILFGIPGETGSTATIIDGYPLAKKGQAGRALGAGAMASFIGGVVGGVALVILIPIVRPIVLAFGSPEMFTLGILGISFVAVLGRGSMTKALIAGALGILLAFVGFHTSTGQLRYTFGNLYFYDGIALAPVFLGIFALPEVIELMVKGGTIAKVEPYKVTYHDIWAGSVETLRHWWLLIRCAVIGLLVGIVPGIGAATAQWLAYGHAKQTSKRASEFGEGCIDGIIACESPDDAKDAGALLTTLALGIPGSAVMALILAAFMMVGVQPGPGMLVEHLDLVWTIVVTLIVANIIGTTIVMLTARDLAKVTFLKGTILVPMIILFVILGAYSLRTNVWDVLLAFVFGGIGYLMKTFDYSRVTFVIGFVLADYIERYFLISIRALGPGFLLVSPIASVLAIITILGLFSRQLGQFTKRLSSGSLKKEV